MEYLQKLKIFKLSRKVIFGVFLVIMSASVLYVDHYMPEKTMGYITGDSVKRTDKDGPISSSNPADGPTVDVYYISLTVEGGDDKDVLVLRNEDTRSSWPFYFKYNSADLYALAQKYSKNHQLVVVNHYGIRSPYFSWFPNLTNIEPAMAGDSTISLWRCFFNLLHIAIWLYVGFKLFMFTLKIEDNID